MAPVITCGNCTKTWGLATRSEKLSISARPFRSAYPRGCCMNEFAIRIQRAEMLEPIATSQMEARCAFFDSRSQPKIHRPRKVDSRKKARSASIARGAPKTSPTNREYSDQFIPNWNSCTIPVTTPIAKLIRKSFPQNFVSRFHTSWPVTYQAVWRAATTHARPRVRGTKKKW
jgi:hypothetical protein